MVLLFFILSPDVRFARSLYSPALPRRSRKDKLNGEKGTRIWRLVRLSPLRSEFTVRVCEKASFFNFSQPAGDAGCP